MVNNIKINTVKGFLIIGREFLHDDYCPEDVAIFLSYLAWHG